MLDDDLQMIDSIRLIALIPRTAIMKAGSTIEKNIFSNQI